MISPSLWPSQKFSCLWMRKTAIFRNSMAQSMGQVRALCAPIWKIKRPPTRKCWAHKKVVVSSRETPSYKHSQTSTSNCRKNKIRVLSKRRETNGQWSPKAPWAWALKIMLSIVLRGEHRVFISQPNFIRFWLVMKFKKFPIFSLIEFILLRVRHRCSTFNVINFYTH